jgi:hypothetical protein
MRRRAHLDENLIELLGGPVAATRSCLDRGNPGQRLSVEASTQSSRGGQPSLGLGYLSEEPDESRPATNNDRKGEDGGATPTTLPEGGRERSQGCGHSWPDCPRIQMTTHDPP